MSGETVTRAKFRCNSVLKTVHTGDQRTYEFTAVYDDGIPENERYAKYTPSGTLRISVDNPNVEFTLGTSYYLDVVEAAE
jgi:hypothetical protein